MKIIVDTREQKPFKFTGFRHYAGIECVSAKLDIGDYSLPGLEDKIAVERKELNDLIQCLCHDRERFKRELERSISLARFAVIVEAPKHYFDHGKYESRMNPYSASRSIASFRAEFGTHFIFAGSRIMAEYETWNFLTGYAHVYEKKFKHAQKILELYKS